MSCGEGTCLFYKTCFCQAMSKVMYIPTTGKGSAYLGISNLHCTCLSTGVHVLLKTSFYFKTQWAKFPALPLIYLFFLTSHQEANTPVVVFEAGQSCLKQSPCATGLLPGTAQLQVRSWVRNCYSQGQGRTQLVQC